MRPGNQFAQVGAGRRFTTRQMQMQNAQAGRFAKNSQPFFGGKFGFGRSENQRIGAVHTMQRAAVSNLGDKGQRIGEHQ